LIKRRPPFIPSRKEVGATWQIYPPNSARDEKAPVAWSSFATPGEADSSWKKPGPAAGPFKQQFGDRPPY
jgi:hypothetical protein